jgi:predicted ester cyclase
MTLIQDRPVTATHAATIKHWVADMVKGDLDKAPYAEDAETSDPTGKFKGKAAIVEGFKAWKTAFPQATAEVTNQIALGDQVTSEILYKATHTGPLVSGTGTIPATNKPVVLKVMQITSFRNGLIQRERSYYDQTDFMNQLGITVPAKP